MYSKSFSKQNGKETSSLSTGITISTVGLENIINEQLM